jgi:Ca2+-binding EF-hand superfamily protein
MSVAARWEDHVKTLFKAFDKDKDGSLNKAELEAIIPVEGVRQIFQGGFYYRAGKGPPPLEQVDADGDGKVSVGELSAYYRPVAADLLKPRPAAGFAGDQDRVTQELFARLDQNGDGKLAQAELRAAEKILLTLDGDEDECVSAAELLNTPARPTAPAARTATAAVARATGLGGPAKPQSGQELSVYPTGIPGAVVQHILKRYDRNEDYEVSRDEMTLDPDVFERLDTNADGKLSATELDGWRTLPPDAVVTMTPAAKAADRKVTARRPDGSAWPAGLEVRQTTPGRLVLQVGTQTADLSVVVPPEAMRMQQLKSVGGAFPEGKTEVTEKDLVGPQNQFLRVIFDAADANGDGKLTRQEYDAYFAIQRQTADLALALTHAVRTPNLFQMLDDNSDGKLSVRELRTAWDRLSVLEPTGAAEVTRAVMQPQVSLRLLPAGLANYDPTTTPPGMQPERPRPTGPVWFQRMDKNNDGDVSRAEFLGSDEAFAKLDANKDDLISLAEADAYEKTARPKPAAKPKIGDLGKKKK